MVLDFIDREYLQKLKKIAAQRNVDLDLDSTRLSDPSYVQWLQSKYPLTTTEAQWTYAWDISQVVQRLLTLTEATNSFACARFIQEHLSEFEEVAPTREMRNFVLQSARRYRIQVSRAVLLNRILCQQWIDNFRSPAVADVVEIMNELSFTHASLERLANEASIVLSEGDWTQTPSFITLMIEKYGRVLTSGDEARKMKHERARLMLSRGADAYSVAAALQLTDAEVLELERIVELSNDSDI